MLVLLLGMLLSPLTAGDDVTARGALQGTGAGAQSRSTVRTAKAQASTGPYGHFRACNNKGSFTEIKQKRKLFNMMFLRFGKLRYEERLCCNCRSLRPQQHGEWINCYAICLVSWLSCVVASSHTMQWTSWKLRS